MRRVLYVGLLVALLVGMTPYSVQAQTLPEPDPPIGPPGGQEGELPWQRLYIPLAMRQTTIALVHIDNCDGPIHNAFVELEFVPSGVIRQLGTDINGNATSDGPYQSSQVIYRGYGGATVTAPVVDGNAKISYTYSCN